MSVPTEDNRRHRTCHAGGGLGVDHEVPFRLQKFLRPVNSGVEFVHTATTIFSRRSEKAIAVESFAFFFLYYVVIAKTIFFSLNYVFVVSCHLGTDDEVNQRFVYTYTGR